MKASAIHFVAANFSLLFADRSPTQSVATAAARSTNTLAVTVDGSDYRVASHIETAAAFWNSYPQIAHRAPVHVYGVANASLVPPIVGSATCKQECTGRAQWCCDPVIALAVNPSLGVLMTDVFIHEIGHVIMNASVQSPPYTLKGGHWSPSDHGEIMSPSLNFPVWIAARTVIAANGMVCNASCNGTCAEIDHFRRAPKVCKPTPATTNVLQELTVTAAVAVAAVAAAAS